MNSVLAVVTAATLIGAATEARAGGADTCTVVDVDFTPSEELQIAVWLEDAAGNYVDTLFLTELTGHRGLGNRPGRGDFNSGPRWPYGRRENTFPIWAHRHGLSWPRVGFQDSSEDDLSHSLGESSVETFYCRPLLEDEAAWDARTCASEIFTDKGVLSSTDASRYPPREDLSRVDGIDDPSVAEFAALNPFDAVTQATPIGGHHRRVYWLVPDDLAPGDYVVRVEVSKEFDHNATYNPATFPEPVGISFGQYGLPYRGQPSVIYQVPFQIGPPISVGTTSAYAGYGAPDGEDGNVRPPDSTIDTDVPGSGGLRLLTTILGTEMYRLRVESRVVEVEQPPGPPEAAEAVVVTASEATIAFTEPAVAPGAGPVRGYEIRYRAGDPMTEGNFFDSSPTMLVVEPRFPGTRQELTVANLLPRTHYFIGIRAFDDCRTYGPLTVIEVETPERPIGEVDACFVATAAYGSLLANDVEMLRHVRDSYLRNNVLGELLVEAYYTFGPALAGLVGASEDLRGIARDLLDPLVDFVRDLSYDDRAEQPD